MWVILSPTLTAVVTGQFNVAMALLQRAQELGVLREFLSKQNQTGYKADQIMKALFKEDNLGKEYSSFCDSVLSSKETFCEGTSVLVAQITVPFQNEASKWLGEVSTETVKKLSLEGLFKLLPPSEDPSSSSSSKEAVNFDLLAEDMSGALNNTGMTDRLANSWAFGERDTAEVLPFLDKAIAHFENKPQLLTRMLCRPNNADVAIPDELAIGGTPRNTPLMLLVKMGNEHAPEAVEKVLPYYDQEALFSTTGNSNSPLHIAVVTGQFDVAMALMKRAAELEVLDEFLAMQNRAGYTADEIMQALVGHPNPNGSYLKLCDSVLGGEEINKARAKGDIAKICHIRNPFFFSARDCSGDRKISSKTIKDYSLKQFFSHLNPEVRDGGNASKLEGKRAAGSSASGSSLAAPEDKEAIKQRIIKTPRYEPSFQDLSVELPSLEYFSLFAHVHEILPGLYLGDYRAFLSVDPEFVQRYKMIDQIEEIGDGRNRQRIMKAVMPNLDKLGCSKLGIGLVVSVTQFQPDPAVPEDDWSLFRPNLDGIKRIQIPVDDTESTWELLEPQLDGIFEVIDQARVEEKPVLVHCVKGACRSAAVMIAYLMNRYEVSYEQAHNYVISTRNQVDIKPSWQGSRESGTGLLGYEAKLRR